MTFIGRTFELQLLEERFASSKGELFILYGRRRVGKTELLTHFCKKKAAVYFTASQVEAKDNLSQFVAVIRHLWKDPALEGLSFHNIEAVLAYLAAKANERRLVVVLDEFQYWVTGDRSVPSLIQRFWDRTGKSSNLVLVLCGSSISMMVEHTLAERSPLYGRRTAQLELKPFDYRTAGKFFPNWSTQDRIKAYGILGGVPAYLSQFDPNISLKDNIQRNILRKGTFLSEEANFLLKTELRDTRIYASILKAIAGGNTSMKDLTSKMGIDARAIATYLANLQALHLVQREVSLAEQAPERSRKGRYLIEDNFLNFWFRFVEPNITFVEINEGSELFKDTIAPQFNAYMGSIFESVCREYVLLYGKNAGLPLAKRVGRVWDKDFDIDVVAECTNGNYIFGECKWSSSPVSAGIVYQLKERVAKSGIRAKKGYYVLFSSTGFKGPPDGGTVLVDLKTMY